MVKNGFMAVAGFWEIIAAAHVAELALGATDHFPAGNLRAAQNAPRRRHQAKAGKRGDRLSAARFAHQAEDVARLKGETAAAHCMNAGAVG
jgi:hypothetical protein